jgi:predicted transcriptional regulator
MPTIWNRDTLGPLEQRLLDLLWERGESSVQDVVALLDRPLAYTTVMTTLDRLFKKGILQRTRMERAFRYSARFSEEDLRRRRAQDFVGGYLMTDSGGLLMSSLVDAVGGHDADLLDELEALIRVKRRELARRKTS